MHKTEATKDALIHRKIDRLYIYIYMCVCVCVYIYYLKSPQEKDSRPHVHRISYTLREKATRLSK